MKKNVYFIQVGVNFGSTLYLPYAAGAIIANCLKYPEISSQYFFPEIIFTRDKIDHALSRITEPYLVAFSCNIWNMEYNKVLAKRVREKYPDCYITFGGHSIGMDDALLRSEEYIDSLIFGEGESVFAEFLKKLPENKLEEVKSLAFRKGSEIVTTPLACVPDLSELPSPFTAGIFDSILKNYPDIEFSTVMETNRGCPYSCAYCEWTHGKRMRFFPLEKVKAEIHWAAENKVPFIYCGDSNFGLYERDLEIVDILARAKQEYGYPEVFRVNYEKNSIDRVFEICKTLNELKMDKGATISYQTLCPEALKNIGRKNLTLEHFSELMRRYSEAGISTYSELILGLPGETYESFCKGICTLLENGQHSSIFVYMCEILPNAKMAEPEFIEKHKIETIKVDFQISHSVADDEDEVRECSRLVRSMDSMDADAWVKSNLFSICVQGYHSFPLLRFFAIYLYEEKKGDYFSFYSGLIGHLLHSPGKMGDVWRKLKYTHDNSLKDGRVYYDKRFGNINWPFEEGVFIAAAIDFDSALEEIMPYLKQFDIEQDVFDDLLAYQTAMLRKPFDSDHSVELEYDFPTYFANIFAKDYKPILKKKTSIKITPDRTFGDVETYAKETVWYGRRKEAALYKKGEIEITYG